MGQGDGNQRDLRTPKHCKASVSQTLSAGESLNFSCCFVPATGHHSETQQDFGNLLTLPWTPTLCGLHPPAPSCLFFPLPCWKQPSPPCANPTAAPLAPFRAKFSLNQGSSGDGGGLPQSNVQQPQSREAPRLPKPHSCMTDWVFCLCIIGLEAKEENYYSVVSQCSCWPLLLLLWFVFVFACSLTSVSGFTARTVSCRHLPV